MPWQGISPGYSQHQTETLDSGNTDEPVPFVSPVSRLGALGRLVGEHREGAGQGRADGPGHGHPVSSPDVAVAEDEGVRGSTDVCDLARPPARRVGEQSQREEDGCEHLNRPAELRDKCQALHFF